MYSPYEDTKCVAQFLEPECVAEDTKCVTDVLCEDPRCVANYRYQIFAFFNDNMSNTVLISKANVEVDEPKKIEERAKAFFAFFDWSILIASKDIFV